VPVRAEPAPAETRALANELRPILVRLTRELRKETTLLGITVGQAGALQQIDENPGIGIRELAELEGIATPTACGIIDRLERVALVRRLRSETDRRRVGVTITPAGRRLLRDVHTRRTVWLAERLERLRPTERAAIEAALEPLTRLSAGENGRVGG
jgi:DNA-binding MarR family transcriptional regulator